MTPSVSRLKVALQFVFLLLIGTGIAVGVRLVSERQDIREEAATGTIKLNKGINFLLETNSPHVSVPIKIDSKDVNYLKDLGVDEVVVATSWSRIACKDPHIYAQEYKPTNISISSELNTNTGDEGFSRQNLVDSRPWSRWSSRNYGTSDPGNVVEWISYQFSAPVTVNQVVLIPAVWNAHRDFGINSFPRSFNISYSDDGTNWHVIKTFDDYPNPAINGYDNTPPTVRLDIPEQTHKYYGFGVTRLRPDYYGGYFAQLGELKFRKVISTNANPEDQNNASYNWAYLDESINTLRNGGLDNIALIIGGTPRWAIMNHEDGCWEAPYFSEFLSYNPYPPNRYDKLNEFSHFAAAVIKRYGGKIRRLSFYNEPNLSMFWKGTISEHVSIHNAAYDKVKQISPSTKIGGGLTAPHGSSSGRNPLNWLSTVKNQNYKFDVYEHHFYPVNDTSAPWSQPMPTDGRVGVGNPEDLLNKLKSLYPGKIIPVVNNEAGYQINKVGLANKAKYIKWILENYKNYSGDANTPFTTWSNFMLYVHPNWKTGLIDIGCKMGYAQASTSSEQNKVRNGEIDKVIKNGQGDCLTPAYYAFKNANTSPPPACSTPMPGITVTCDANYKNDLICSWGSVSNATEYQVQIDNNSDFSSPLLDTTPTGTSVTKSAVNANVNYYCRSRVVKSNGSCTVNNQWSTATSVKKACPTPIPIPNCSTPNPGITATCNINYKNDLKCSWSSVSNATEYQGQIDNNSDFSSPLVDTVGSSTSRSIGNVTAGRTYYCRSRVTKSNGSCTVNSKWSSVDTVNKACPTPIPTTTNTPTPTERPTNTPVPTDKPTNTPVVTSTPIPVPGDATGDGVVDIEDYKVWVNNYNSSTQEGPTNADFDNNGRVDGKDYIIWQKNYGN